MTSSCPRADRASCAEEGAFFGVDFLDADFFDDDVYAFYTRGAPPRVFGRFRRAREFIAELLGLLALLAVLSLLGIVQRAKASLEG
jgi:hypothetical protein